jgi:hypothetical protein
MVRRNHPDSGMFRLGHQCEAPPRYLVASGLKPTPFATTSSSHFDSNSDVLRHWTN